MFDLIILGGGPGGYHLASLAGKANKKVALVEQSKLGGTCLNSGCIPSKAFLHIAKLVEEANGSHTNGIIGKKLSINQNQVVDYKNQKVDLLVSGIDGKMKAAKVKVFQGKGEILKNSEYGKFKVKVNQEVIEGSHLVIATGSKIFIPSFIKGAQEGYQKGYVLSSTEILNLREIPSQLVIIGGGVIGIELGSYFATAGSKVVVIEASDKILGPLDQEISTQFQEYLEKHKKMTFLLNCKALEITQDQVIYQDKTNETHFLKHDKVLVSIGRKANLDCGLENIDVDVENDFVNIDNKCQTNIPQVYAIGDVTGKSMLAQTASYHGEVVLNNLLGKNDIVEYHKIPAVIYGHPEVAEIGLSQSQAEKQGIAIKVKKIPLLYSGRFVVEDNPFTGLFKIIIKKASDEIIGLAIFGSNASELIHMGSILIGQNFNTTQVQKLVFAHPTVGEVIKDAIYS